MTAAAVVTARVGLLDLLYELLSEPPLTNEEAMFATPVVAGLPPATAAARLRTTPEAVTLATVRYCWQQGEGWRPGVLSDYEEGA